MVDHLYGYYIYDEIDVTQFDYDGFHTVGTKFYEDTLMNIGKKWEEEVND